MSNSNLLQRLSEPLKIEDVDFRIQSINNGGYATILAYKDARVDMNRLDEVCGVNWQDDYKLIDNQLFCGIAIKVENDWIWRWDVGAESFTEKVKGRASDAFKRAGFRWGIGRELYDYPTIQVKLNQNEFKVENNKVKQTWNLKLKEWIWNAEFKDGEITSLTAKDNKGIMRYNSKQTTNKPQTQTQTQPQPQKDLKWLNVMSGKNFTPEWKNLLDAINNGKIKDVSQVRKFYKVSKEVEEKINNVLNF